MNRFATAPWGRLHWLLPKLGGHDWCVLGCISAEERCLAAWEWLRNGDAENDRHFVRILPPTTHPSETEMLGRQEAALDRFLELGGERTNTTEMELFASHGLLHSTVGAFLDRSGPNILLDISSMPKRFFFPALKFLSQDSRVENLIVVYTLPLRYGEGALYTDIEAPTYIPAFMPKLTEFELDAEPDLIIGVGFESPGLSQVVGEDHDGNITYLFPFPAPPPISKGTWDFLRDGLSLTPVAVTSVSNVSVIDAVSTFDQLCSLTEGGKRPTILAPYGPKPMSLAMCLFALGPGSDTAAVRYAQPKHYNPEYSIGTKCDEHGCVSYAYAVRIAGRNLYSTSSC